MNELFSEEAKNENERKKKNTFVYIVNDYFQDKGKTKKAIIEEYIMQEASGLL